MRARQHACSHIAPRVLRAGVVTSRALAQLQDYGAEPKFDASDRRATWTMLHTTAAYLPEKLQPEEAAGFRDLVSSAVNLYPGDGGRRIQNP